MPIFLVLTASLVLLLYKFQSNMWQQLATTLLIYFGQVMGLTKGKGFNMATAKKLLPLSVFYNANVAFALASLKGVNIPMYIAIKRLTPLAVLVAGILRGKGKPPMQVSDMYFMQGIPFQVPVTNQADIGMVSACAY